MSNDTNRSSLRVYLAGLATAGAVVATSLAVSVTVLPHVQAGRTVEPALELSTPSATGPVQTPASPDRERQESRPVLFEGTLRDFVEPKFQADYDSFIADSASRASFFEALQGGLDASTGGGQQPTAQPATGATVQNVLAYGFDRDHVWATMSFADVARGAISVAAGYCKRYVPGWICDAAARWLQSMAQGYAPLANHGIWGAIYWNRYQGGRW